jgi:hypothetical protein
MFKIEMGVCRFKYLVFLGLKDEKKSVHSLKGKIIILPK